MPIELLPIMIPALVIVAVAVRLVGAAASGRSTDTVLDLRDPAPIDRERLGSVPRPPTTSAPTTTAWSIAQNPLPGGTLGDRLRSVESVVVLPPEPAPDPVHGRGGRVVIGRRRSRPLVAQR